MTAMRLQVTGGALAGLATAYVAAINGGAVPDIKKSWDYVVDESLRKAFEGEQRFAACTLSVFPAIFARLPEPRK